VLLATTSVGEAGTLTSEVGTGTGYARVSVPISDAAWTEPTLNAEDGYTYVSNAVEIAFPKPAGDWAAGADIAAWGWSMAASGGDVILYGSLTNPKKFNANSPAPKFSVGELKFGMKTTSQWLDAAILNHIFRSTKLAKPAQIAYAMDRDNGSGGWIEVAGGGYQRPSVAPGAANYSTPTAGNGRFANLNKLSFGTPATDASGSWGLCGRIRMLSGANVIAQKTFPPQHISAGDGEVALQPDTAWVTFK